MQYYQIIGLDIILASQNYASQSEAFQDAVCCIENEDPSYLFYEMKQYQDRPLLAFQSVPSIRVKQDETRLLWQMSKVGSGSKNEGIVIP